jgi:hypothetical protein
MDRGTVVSTGEHLAALTELKKRGVGAEYTDQQYVAALELVRELGAGEAYADEGLAERLVARLERDGFGQITDRQKSQRLEKIDSAIKVAETELREARKAEAIAALEEQFAA